MITDYDSLSTSLSGWLNSNNYAGNVSEFVQLAEAHFNRELRVPQMEATATSSASSESLSLPTDFLAARTVYLDDDPDRVLVAMPLSALRAMYPNSASGITAAYAVSGQNIILAPAPSETVTVTLAYFQKIPGLEENSTNWLIENHPDLYLAGAKYMAFDYMRDEEKADKELARVALIIDSIQSSGNQQRLPAGPLAMRPDKAA